MNKKELIEIIEGCVYNSQVLTEERVCFNELRKELNEELPEQLILSSVSTWIKISDQEPPKNIEVLAQCPKGVNYLTSWRTNYAVFSCQRKLDSSWDWKWKLID